MLNANDLLKRYRCVPRSLDRWISAGYLRPPVVRRGRRFWRIAPSQETLQKRIMAGRFEKMSAAKRKMWAEGRGRRNDGINNSNSKLTEDQVKWIWWNQRVITTGEMLWIVGLADNKVIRRIISGENWGPITSKIKPLPAQQLGCIAGEEIRLIPSRPSFGISRSGKIYFFRTAADDKSLIFWNPIPKHPVRRKQSSTPTKVRFANGDIKDLILVTDLIAEAWPEKTSAI